MSGATLDTAGPLQDSRTRLSRSLDGLSSAIPLPVKVPYAVRTPWDESHGLGSSAFARRYLRNHCYFLFLRLLRCSSPRLFAAYRVFHRLPVPGHPPCALLCLTSCTYGSSLRRDSPHSPIWFLHALTGESVRHVLHVL